MPNARGPFRLQNSKNSPAELGHLFLQPKPFSVFCINFPSAERILRNEFKYTRSLVRTTLRICTKN